MSYPKSQRQVVTGPPSANIYLFWKVRVCFKFWGVFPKFDIFGHISKKRQAKDNSLGT